MPVNEEFVLLGRSFWQGIEKGHEFDVQRCIDLALKLYLNAGGPDAKQRNERKARAGIDCLDRMLNGDFSEQQLRELWTGNVAFYIEGKITVFLEMIRKSLVARAG